MISVFHVFQFPRLNLYTRWRCGRTEIGTHPVPRHPGVGYPGYPAYLSDADPADSEA